MNRGARRLGFGVPDFGGTLQDKHDEWVQQIWMNRKRKATHKIIDLCDHAHGVDEDGYCLICTGETNAAWQIDTENGIELPSDVAKSGGEVDKTTTDQISCDTKSTENLKPNDLKTEVECDHD
jgi:hypothetical protein